MGCFLKSPLFRVLLLFTWVFVSAVSFVHCAEEEPDVEYLTLPVSGTPADAWERVKDSELEALAHSLSPAPKVQEQLAVQESENSEENPEDVYPVVFVHGWVSKPTEMQPLLDKIPWDREQPLAELYAQDAVNLTGAYSRNTLWNVGYYKSSASYNGQYEYPGRISHVPITAECSLPFPEDCVAYYEDYNSRIAYDQQLEIIIDNILRVTGAPKVNIVAHSMGGLVARAFIQLLNGGPKIHKFLMLGTPNHGIALSDAAGGYCYNTNAQEWMDIGELSEMIGDYDSNWPASTSFVTCPLSGRSCNSFCGSFDYFPNAWEGTTFTNYLNAEGKPWGGVRYATIAGTKCVDRTTIPPGCDGPEDGVVNSSSVYLDNAVFNSKYYGSHSTGEDPNPEFTITESTFTTETIRQWIGQNYIASNPIFNFHCDHEFCSRNPSNIMTYEIAEGDAVATQVAVYFKTGGRYATQNLLGVFGFALDHGQHDILIPFKSFSTSFVIKVYDQYGERFTQGEDALMCCDNSAYRMPSTIVTDKPLSHWAKSSATVQFYPDMEDSESRWSIDHGPWTEWSTDQSVTVSDPTPGYHTVQIASKLAESDWMDQSVTTASWFQYEAIVDPAILTVRDAKYDNGGRLFLGWQLSDEDQSRVSSYEIFSVENWDEGFQSMSSFVPGTDRVVDAAEGVGGYFIRTHSAEGYEDSDYVTAPTPEDNVASELVLTHIGEDLFRFQLIDVLPRTTYVVESFQNTDKDYAQTTVSVTTDELGNAEGEIFAHDYSLDDSYTFAIAYPEFPIDPANNTYASNYIYNSRQVNEALTINPLPSVVEDGNVTLSGNKNTDTSVFLNDEEIVPLNSSTTWSAIISLDPGYNFLVLKTQNEEGEINGVHVAILLYAYGKLDIEDTRYDNGGAFTLTWEEDDPEVAYYELFREKSGGERESIGKRPAESGSFVDRNVDQEANYEYVLRAYHADGSFSDYYFSYPISSPADNILRTILLKRVKNQGFAFQLVDAEPSTDYTVYSYHHTDQDYLQASLPVRTDREGYANGEIFSRDEVKSDDEEADYVHVTAVREGETLDSNRIYNVRQVTSEFSVDAIPEAVYDNTLLLSGTKNTDSAVSLNGEALIALSPDTNWTASIALEEGENIFVLTAESSAGEINGYAIGETFYVTGPKEAPTVNPIPEIVTELVYTISGTKPSASSLWINEEMKVPLNDAFTWEVTLELAEGWNYFEIDARDEWKRRSAPVEVSIFVDLDAVPGTTGDVSNFSAWWDGQAVQLSWTNPTGDDFNYVSLGKMPENPRALYVWDSNNIVTDLVNDAGTSRDDLFAFLAAPHDLIEKPIRTLYFAAVTNTVNHIRDNAANLRGLIAEAATHDVHMVYLDGDPTWATTGAAVAQARLGDMIAFNAAGNDDERFIGVQFDVEPYLLSGWYSDEIWEGYLGFLGRSQETVETSGQDIFFSVDIPFWYDDGVSGHPDLHEDVVDIVDEVVVMDYRDSAWGSGHGGAIGLVENELAYAEAIEKKLSIALETQEIAPDYISFFEEGVARMEDEVGLLNEKVQAVSAFHEFAVHYYTPYRDLTWKASGELTGIWDILGTEGDGGDDSADKLVGVDNSRYFVEAIVHALPQVPMTIWQLNIGIDSVVGSDPGLLVDIYMGETVSATQIADPVVVKSGWIPEWHGSWQSLTLDVPFKVEAAKSYGMWFKTRSVQGMEGSHYLRLSSDKSSAPQDRFAVKTDIWYVLDRYGAIQLVDLDPAIYTHTPLDRWFTEIYKGTDESFVDTAVSPPQTLIYRIYAVDTAGNASDGEVATVKAGD